ncbi:MAG: hypothetical protein K2Y71_16475 [Xanthobacteraceae bacterium]|nr:hypothetical protein [Xanthobacteraceae bacterium]
MADAAAVTTQTSRACRPVTQTAVSGPRMIGGPVILANVYDVLFNSQPASHRRLIHAGWRFSSRES